MTIFVALIISHGFAAAGTKPRPPLADYLERHLRDCVMYQGLDVEACETQLERRYRRAPYFTADQFLKSLARDKAYLRELSVVDEAQLATLASELRALPVDYFNEIDGCAERAEGIAYVLWRRHGLKVGQIYARGSLRIRAIHIPLHHATIRWGFHIAPMILVRNAQGRIQPYSLDLTLLAGTPRPLVDWLTRLQADTPLLMEIHHLKGFETAPAEPGDDKINSWNDRATDLIEDRLNLPNTVTVHANSPLRPDLADAARRALLDRPLSLRYADDTADGGRPRDFTAALNTELRAHVLEKVARELRCEGTSSLRCSVYYEDPGTGFCRVDVPLASPTATENQIHCYPFDR